MSIFRDSYTYQQIKVALLSDLPTYWPSHVIYYVEEGTGSYWIFRNGTVEEVYNFTPSAITGFVKTDGTTALTDDWDAGDFQITTRKLVSVEPSQFGAVVVGSGVNTGLPPSNLSIGAGGNIISATTTGSGNIALGYNALYDVTDGSSNVAIGTDALRYNTTGDTNTAIGGNTLYSNTTGYDNIAIGYTVLHDNTTGYYNVGIGSYSLSSNTIGQLNTAIGIAALNSNTEGNQNTGIGFTALVSNTTGANNTALGYSSLGNNTTGVDNTAVGSESLNNTATGFSNTAIGRYSMYYNNTGHNNTAVGLSSLYNNQDGYYNVAIGPNAGSYLADGITQNTSSYSSIYIGKDTKSSSAEDQNSITIGVFANSMGSNTTVIGHENTTGDAYIRGNHHLDDERSIIFHQSTLAGQIQQPGISDNRYWNLPDKNGTFAMVSDLTGGTVTSVSMTVPAAFSVANSPITSSGSLDVTANGYATQYIRGDGQLANFPTSLGGGSSVSYYANGGTTQGTFGGNTYYQISRTADTGTAVDIVLSSGTPTVRFITDANDPDQLTVPQGSWIFRSYLNQSNNSGNCTIQVSLYKYDGASFTLIGTGPTETITNGTTVDLYTHSLTIPAGIILAETDRLAIEYTAGSFGGGKTVTLHTQDSHLAQIQTTYSTGLTTLNGLVTQDQYFAVSTSGTDFAISSADEIHTFNLPTASASNRGALSSADWSTFNGKQDTLVSGTSLKTINSTSLLSSGNLSLEPTITAGTTSQYWRGDKTWQTLSASTIGLGNVENTALSTWGGSSSLYILGTVTSGTWHGTAIGDSYLASTFIKANGTVGLSADWNAGSYRITTGNITSTGDALVNGMTIGKGPNSIANNTVVGEQALNSNLTGGNNTTIGYQAGSSATGVFSLTAVGFQSSKASTVSITSFGSQSALNNTTGTQNTALGFQSLLTNTTAISNTAIGYRSLYNNNGNSNLAVGVQALYTNTTGIQNVALGNSTLYNNTTGQNNMAVGINALVNNTTGNNNAAIGFTSLNSNTTGANNTSIGGEALYNNTTGSDNIAVGYQSGKFLSDGTTANQTSNNSIFIGNASKANTAGGTNEIVIGYNTFGNGSNTTTIGKQGTTTQTFVAGSLKINNAYTLPSSDGTSNQILKTNGAGIVSWATDSGGIAYTDLSASTPLSYNNLTGAFSIQAGNTSQNGYISSTDWNTFNGKQTAYTNLTSIGGLANGSGWLKNDGTGTFSYATPTKSDIGLGSVENTALSTWAGTTNITTLGTVVTGIWNGTAIGDSYISSASTWNAKQNALTIGNLTESTSSVLTITGGTGAIIGSGLSVQVKQATTSQSGYLSSTDWNTFNNKGSGSVTSVAALTLGTTGTDVSSTVATGTTTPVITLNIPTASATNRGALSSTDWNTFNGKQNVLSGTGFVKSIGGVISYDTNAYLTGNQSITLSGDVTGSGTTGITASISAATVTGKAITGFVSGAGTVSATDTILQAINKLDGNVAGKQTALSGTGFVKISGTSISYDNSTYLTTSSASSTYLAKSSNLSDLNNKYLGRANLLIDSGTTGGNSNVSIGILNTQYLTTTPFTAPRTWTLPDASTVNAGWTIYIADIISTITTTNTLTVAVQTGQSLNNTVNGTAVFNTPGSAGYFISDGNGNWAYDSSKVTLNSAQTLTNKTLTNAIVGTQSPLDNSTKAASTAYVDAAVTAGGGGGGSFNYGLANALLTGNFLI
jgi:trimeric autotransporter adhesin